LGRMCQDLEFAFPSQRACALLRLGTRVVQDVSGFLEYQVGGVTRNQAEMCSIPEWSRQLYWFEPVAETGSTTESKQRVRVLALWVKGRG
jgi:hypothetical protein